VRQNDGPAGERLQFIHNSRLDHDNDIVRFAAGKTGHQYLVDQ
jgi:hypothetical protein